MSTGGSGRREVSRAKVPADRYRTTRDPVSAGARNVDVPGCIQVTFDALDHELRSFGLRLDAQRRSPLDSTSRNWTDPTIQDRDHLRERLGIPGRSRIFRSLHRPGIA